MPFPHTMRRGTADLTSAADDRRNLYSSINAENQGCRTMPVKTMCQNKMATLSRLTKGKAWTGNAACKWEFRCQALQRPLDPNSERSAPSTNSGFMSGRLHPIFTTASHVLAPHGCGSRSTHTTTPATPGPWRPPARRFRDYIPLMARSERRKLPR